MSNVKAAAPAAPKKLKDMQTRISDLETANAQIQGIVPKLIQMIQGGLEAVDRRLSGEVSKHQETLNALVAISGEESVVEMVEQRRRDAAFKKAELEQKSIEDAIQKGVFVVGSEIRPVKYAADPLTGEVTDAIEDRGSIVEGCEYDSGGNAMVPGWVIMRMSDIRPAVQALLVGKSAGDEVATFKIKFDDGEPVKDEAGNFVPNGGKFVVKRVLENAPPKPEPALEAPPALAQPEAPPAPAPTQPEAQA